MTVGTKEGSVPRVMSAESQTGLNDWLDMHRSGKVVVRVTVLAPLAGCLTFPGRTFLELAASVEFPALVLAQKQFSW